MKVHDISLPITPDLVIWPGDPELVVERVRKIEDGDMVNVTRLAMCAHSGTHVDAPLHFIRDGYSVDDLPWEALIGPARVVQIPADRDLVTAELLDELGIPEKTRRVLFRTGNARDWQAAGQVFSEKFVSLDASAAQWLVDRGVLLVGVDYLSVAPFDDPSPTHLIVLGAGMVVLESTDLSEVEPGEYTLVCLPIRLVGAEGAPARAVLLEDFPA